MIYLDGGVVDFGKQLKVAIGPDSGQRTVFDGTISAIEAVFDDGEPPLVVLFAEDALMKLRMTRRLRTYTDVTDADIAARRWPPSTACSARRRRRRAALRRRPAVQPERPGVPARAGPAGAGRAVVRRPHPAPESRAHAGPGTRLTLVQGNHLLSVRLCADLAHQRSEVAVTGYDASAKDVIDERAGADAIDAEISSAAGPARRWWRRRSAASTTLRVREAPLTTARGQRVGEGAEMLRRGRGGSSRWSGRPAARRTWWWAAGSPCSGVGAPFEGDGYYVTRVRHTVDLVRGLRTRFEAERATVNEVA